MKFDLDTLVSHLRNAEAEDPKEDWQIPDYVFEHIFWPLMCDKKVLFEELDYSRFNYDDLFLTADAIERACMGVNLAEKIRDVFLGAAPVSAGVRSYC